MGVSTDASIAYGVDLGEEFDWDAIGFEPEDPIQSFEDYVLGEAGIVDPRPDDYWERGQNERAQWDAEHDFDPREFYRVRAEALDDFPIQMDVHCSDQVPMYVVYRRGTLMTARRGYPVTIHSLPRFSPEAFTYLAEQIFGTLTEEPRWLLYSYWG